MVGFWVSGEEEVEQVADDHDAGGGDAEECGEQRRFEDAAQQDQLWQAERDNGHHEGQQGAHGQALVVESLDQGHDAGGVRVERNADRDGDEDAEGVAGAGVGGEELGGDPAVDDGAEPDPDEQIGPDLLEDGGDLFDAHLDALVEAQARGGVDRLAAELGLEDERFDPFLDAEPTEDPAGDDRDDQAGADVDGGDLPAEEAEQQADGDLVDHRAGDQEAQGDPDRDPGGDEPDEGGDGAAGAKRGDDAEPGGQHVADALTFAAEQGPGAFDAHVGAQHRHHEDDQHEQQGDLDGVVEEEVQGLGEPVVRHHPEPVVQQDVPEPAVDPIHRDPGSGGTDQGEQLATAGGGKSFGDVHRYCCVFATPGRAACKRSSASLARV